MSVAGWAELLTTITAHLVGLHTPACRRRYCPAKRSPA